MYNQKFNYVIVGAFVSAMIVAGIVSVALLTGQTGAVDAYYLVLRNVTDVKFGTQVRYEGYPIGQVEEITPVPEGAGMKFRLDLSIRQGWQIPDNSIARIGSSSFLAAKTIDIQSGDSSRIVALGGEIPSGAPSDIFSAMATTASEISELSRTGITPLLATLNSLATTMEGDAPKITAELISFSQRLNEVLTPIQDLLTSENILSAEHTIENMEEMSGNLTVLSGELKGTLRKVDNLTTNLDQLVEDNKGNMDQSLKDVQYTLSSIAGTVGSIVHNLEGAARNMNEFSRLIRQNPGLLLDGTPREAVSPARINQTEKRE